MAFKLLGAGSPLVDISLAVSGDFLEKFVPGGKGGTRNISSAVRDVIIEAAANPPLLLSPGGSAGNCVRMFSALGGGSALFGKIGNDEYSDFFRHIFREYGVDDTLLITDHLLDTGYCLSLITDDAERTMLSDLGASLAVTNEDLNRIDFSKFGWLLLEGYLVDGVWVEEFLCRARKNKCKIAIDLNNFELVYRKRDLFNLIIDHGIDLIFANIREIEALFGSEDIEQIADLLTKRVPMAVIKLGPDGAYVISGNQRIMIPAVRELSVVDTTGAGDFFAAGFFYGLSRNMPLAVCGRLGALTAAAIIVKNGTLLNKNELKCLINAIDNEVKNELPH